MRAVHSGEWGQMLLVPVDLLAHTRPRRRAMTFHETSRRSIDARG